MRESDVERYLVNKVRALGGECRKVVWVGRKSAPDRLVMLPPRFVREQGDILAYESATIWVELKRPGKLANFPADAHERAQAREHDRMRAMGQRVVVIDSILGVEELLA